MLCAIALDVHACGVILEDTLAALHRIDARVRTRAGHIVLQPDGTTLRRLDQRGVQVTGHVLLLPARRVLRLMLGAPVRQAGLGRAHRDDVLEAVAAIDVHERSHGAESVRRIEVAVALRVMRATPEPFITCLEQDFAQVVIVGGTTMLDLTKQAGAHHVQHQQLVVAVAAVLQHDAVASRLLRRLHQLPAIVDGVCRRHLRRGMLAGLHRSQADGHVQLPRRGRVHDVDVVAQDELFVGTFAITEQCGLVHVAGRLHGRHGKLQLVRHGVAECRDLHVRHAQQLVEHGSSAQAGTDDRDAHDIVLRERDTEHRGVPARQFRGCIVRCGRRRVQSGGQAECEPCARQCGTLQQVAAMRIIRRVWHGAGREMKMTLRLSNPDRTSAQPGVQPQSQRTSPAAPPPGTPRHTRRTRRA